MSDDTLTFLESEAKSAERGLLVTTVVGVAAAGLAAGYLLWTSSALEEIAQPSVVADVAAATATRAIPEIGKDLRKQLLEAAPALARSVTTEAVGAIPALRAALENRLTQMTDEMALASAEDVGGRFRRALVALPKTGTPEEQVDRAVAAVVKELEAEMAKPVDRGESEAQAGIFGSFRQSASYLAEINAKLKRLSSKRRLTAQETATRRLLVRWLGLVDPGDDATAVAQEE